MTMLGTQSKPQIMSNLSSSPVLVVLDNAEVFEDAADRAAQEQISSIVSDIANTRGVTVILTSRTSRNARLASWTEVRVPPLDKLPARQYFRRIYHGEISDDDVDEVLVALDFHPLSIHILAYTAKESQWTGEEFLVEWNAEQIRLLQTEDNKENLGFTIRLSLNSPSVKTLGDDALDVLRIISFFPQGINRKHIALLFPSIPHISSLVDTLCKVSLVYRSGSFLTILAPIRLFLIDAFPTAGFGLLDDIRSMYYNSLKEISGEKDWSANLIVSDHLNIEHLIVYDFTNTLRNIRDTIVACYQFLTGLEYHKLRPVESLVPVISALSEESNDDKQMKAWCLESLGDLYFALSSYASASTAYSAVSKLFLAVENQVMAAHNISSAATSHINLGYYSQGQHLIDEFINSPSWRHIDEEHQASIHFTFDSLSMYTSHDKADQLFLRSVDHPWRGPQSRLRHWTARMYHGYSEPEEVERNLEPIRSLCMSSDDTWDQWFFFEAMAEAAFLQRKFDTAEELLKQAHDAINDDLLLTLMVLCNQAAVASVQGNYEFARSQLQQTLDTLSVVATPSSAIFLEMRYIQGQNELYAKNYAEAHRLLADVAVDSNAQGNIRTQVKCMRALGELEYLLGRTTESDRYFAQAVELCEEAGVPPELLGICEPMMRLDDERFPGWRTFLHARAITSPDRPSKHRISS
ncbi:hypothetical protein JVU11DRAFT_2265 [Chiua virens]|nr:hypothetical protein JVU11DRAFT_2265 [Chiua virens]